MNEFTLRPVFIEATPFLTKKKKNPEHIHDIVLGGVFHAAGQPVNVSLANVTELGPYRAITKFHDENDLKSSKNTVEDGTSLTLITGKKYFVALESEAFKKKYAIFSS